MRLAHKGMAPVWFMNGICYRSKPNDSLLFEHPINDIPKSKIAPFSYPSTNYQIKKLDGFNRYYFGMSQAGFSLHMVPNKEDLVLGSPGILNWKGVPLLVEVEERVPTRDERIFKNIASTAIQYNNNYDTIDAIENYVQYSEYFGKSPKLRKNLVFSNYFFFLNPNFIQLKYATSISGYSVSSGCYFQKGERWFSSGLPRGDNLNGRVLIFSHPNKTHKFFVKSTLNGEQHGEYFGSTLASCDLNNDGKDDLAVGAPLWTNELEEGRIYIFSSKGNDVSKDLDFLFQIIHKK